MDQFGALVESIGFKSQSSSTPLAKLKSEPNKPSYRYVPPPQPPSSTQPLQSQGFEFGSGNLDNTFQSVSKNNFSNTAQKSHDPFGGDDLFGGPFSNLKPPGGSNGIDLDAFFVGNSGSFPYGDDDIFGLNSKKNGSGFDDLIPGFGQSSSPSNYGENTATGRSRQSSTPSNSGSTLAEDPLSIFKTFASHQDKPPKKSSSSIDELEDFAMGRSQKYENEQGVKISKEAITRVQGKLINLKDFGNKGNAASDRNIKVSLPKKDGKDSKVTPETQFTRQTERVKAKAQTAEEKNISRNEDDLDALFFSKGSQTTNSRRPRSIIEDPIVDSLFSGGDQTKVERTSSQAAHTVKKAPSPANYVEDFSFFGEPSPFEVEFHEIDGEPEERRRARLNQHMRTKERMRLALAEKNQRDLEAQHEQEERHRLAESMDGNIKRWAAGKEGNLRALLSSLQYILWPECGWQPVSLTDMITSVSVKKVYHKATLCVHPDKVQQKGANVEQKYIAEKVFDLLKEAFNKFNAEELR